LKVVELDCPFVFSRLFNFQGDPVSACCCMEEQFI